MLKVIILPLALLLVTIQAQELEYDEEGVLIAQDDNLDIAINKYKYLLLEFYATWCKPCVQFAPEYAKLAHMTRDEDIPIVIAKIDAGTHRLTQQRFKIKEYPTIVLLINGYPINYEGQRAVASIMTFIKDTVGETLDELPTADDVDETNKFVKESDVTVVLFLESLYDKSLHAYNAVSKFYPDITFGYTNSGEARRVYKVRKNSVVLFKNFDEERNEFRGRVTEKALMKFIDENGYPTFGEFDERAEERIFKRQKNALILFWNDEEESLKSKAIIQSIAPHIKKRVQIVAVHPKDGFLTSISERLGVSSIKFPELFFFQTYEQKQETFRFRESFNIDSIMRFMAYAKAGKIERNYRSQDPPEEQNSIVLVVVGETFQQQVLESGKDTVVEFCASFSKECQSFEANYTRVAESFRDNDNIQFGVIDIVRNEVPNTKIQNYPTFKLYRALLPLIPLEFSGQLSEESLTEFVRAHTQGKKSDL